MLSQLNITIQYIKYITAELWQPFITQYSLEHNEDLLDSEVCQNCFKGFPSLTDNEGEVSLINTSKRQKLEEEVVTDAAVSNNNNTVIKCSSTVPVVMLTGFTVAQSKRYKQVSY